MIKQSSFFEDEELDRLDIEWMVYNALRDGVRLGLRDSGRAGHRDTLRLASKIAPKVFAATESLLVREWESPEEREVREIAVAQDIPFEAALNSEIERLEAIVKGNSNRENLLRTLNRRLSRLKTIKSESELREFYEGKLIERDARRGYGGSPRETYSDNNHDFSLPAGRHMRIRVTHGTKIEEINGADLIYEHHLPDSCYVRIAAVQYKILKEDRYVPKSKQLNSQLSRLESCFCKELLCKSDEIENHKLYRLPTCTAFLRPTYRLHENNSSILSRGFYLPICVVQTLWRDNKPINDESVDKQVVRQGMFEDLFNSNLLGSKWLTVNELDSIYKTQKILEPYETAVIHVKCYE